MTQKLCAVGMRNARPGNHLKVLANEDTLLRTHCCRHKCFSLCPRAQHLLRTQILCPGHKNVSDFVQNPFVSATNVSQFARARKRHEQQCFRNNVYSFATAFKVAPYSFWTERELISKISRWRELSISMLNSRAESRSKMPTNMASKIYLSIMLRGSPPV